MKKWVWSVFAALALTATSVQGAHAGELDILLDKLVEKGVLSPTEAAIVKDETMIAVSGEVAGGKSYAVPSWVQSMKIKQDIRLRYQKEIRDSDVKHRNRARIRYRLSVLANPFKDIEVGLGLATGSSDPRSTNQTLENNFSTKNFNLDLAYLQWTAANGLQVVGGKFKRAPYLWEPTDLLWDGDINPEGVSAHYERELSKQMTGYVNAGWWNLDERDQNQGDLANPFMYYLQLGNKWNNEKFDTHLAATVYKFSNVKGNELGDNQVVGDDNGSDTNTESNNLLVNDYDAKVLGAEVGIKNPFGLSQIERFALFGQYVNNFTISKDDQGFALGFKFGDKSVKNKGSWQFKYIYAELQRDAWLDIFPDSDRYGGKTDIKAHEAAITYALRKNMTLGLDLYKAQRLDNGKNEELLGQLDLVLKF